MHRWSALAALALALQICIPVCDSFDVSGALRARSFSPPFSSSSSHKLRGETRHASVTSTTAADPSKEEVKLDEQSERRRQVSRPPASKRRATRAIRRRARRLARFRRKRLRQATARATTIDIIVSDDQVVIRDSNELEAQQQQAVLMQPTPDEDTDENGVTPLSRIAVLSPPPTTVDATGVDVSGSAIKEDRPAIKVNNSDLHTAATTLEGRPIVHGEGRGLWRSIFGPRPLLDIHSVEELSRLVDVDGWKLEDLSVVTGTAGAGGARAAVRAAAGADEDAAADITTDGAHTPHPVVQAVLERAAAGTTPSKHADGRRIGLAIEGGGMRGCVAAGMASCLHYLGLADSFDGVYGASAGSLVGAYFVSRQPNGTAVYHNTLPCAGSQFIDMAKFPQALGLGFGLPTVTLGSGRNGGDDDGDGSCQAVEANGNDSESARKNDAKAMAIPVTTKFARVIGLDFLLKDVVGRNHALDFEAFRANDQQQPLHVLASGISSMRSVSLASRRGHFSTLDQLTGCIRASMLVPGLAGPPVTAPRNKHTPSPPSAVSDRRAAVRKKRLRGWGSESLTKRNNDGGEIGGRMHGSPWRLGGWWPRRRFSRSLARGGRSSSAVEGGSDWSTVAVGEEGCRDSPTTGVGGVGGSDEGVEASGADGDVGAVASDEKPEEFLVDAMVFEPLPYRSAVDDRCTDVLVLCTRPEGSQVLGKKPGLYESRVVKKYFEQQENPETTSKISDHLRQLKHLRTYAEDALVLGHGSRTRVPQMVPHGGPGAGKEAFLLAVAPHSSCKEVSQLEMDRKVILQGCREGFAACYDLFAGSMAVKVAEAEETTRGGADDVGVLTRSAVDVALEYFPDSILSTPCDMDATYFEQGGLIGADFAPADSTRPATTTAALAAAYGDSDSGGVNSGTVSSKLTAVRSRITTMAAGGGGFAGTQGGRGLLRRVLSLGKLRLPVASSSPRFAAVAAAVPTDVVPDEKRTRREAEEIYVSSGKADEDGEERG